MSQPALYRKLRALVARAAHQTTPEEEARTSAVIACRLIQEAGVLDAGEKEAVKAAEAAPRMRPIRLTAKYRGWCLFCFDRYLPGDAIVWAKGEGATHDRCRGYWQD